MQSSSLPATSMYFPAVQATQSSAVGPEISLAVEKRPAAQSPEHALVVAPAAPYFPASQLSHAEVAVFEYLPTGHSDAQFAFPAEENVPKAQLIQSSGSSLPATSMYFPASQAMHSVCAVLPEE